MVRGDWALDLDLFGLKLVYKITKYYTSVSLSSIWEQSLFYKVIGSLNKVALNLKKLVNFLSMVPCAQIAHFHLVLKILRLEET